MKCHNYWVKIVNFLIKAYSLSEPLHVCTLPVPRTIRLSMTTLIAHTFQWRQGTLSAKRESLCYFWLLGEVLFMWASRSGSLPDMISVITKMLPPSVPTTTLKSQCFPSLFGKCITTPRHLYVYVDWSLNDKFFNHEQPAALTIFFLRKILNT